MSITGEDLVTQEVRLEAGHIGIMMMVLILDLRNLHMGAKGKYKCGYVYNPEKVDPKHGIEAGTVKKWLAANGLI